MKKRFLGLLVLVIFTMVTASAQVVYVNINATGNNDGTSWADAYFDLNTALVNTDSNAQIWIAAGFYTRFSKDESFIIDDNESLYGGFAGTETSLDQRDFSLNETILSGDVDLNDEGNASSENYSMLNNAEHIIKVTSDGHVIIDGIHIVGAYSTTAAGGGILVDGSILDSLTVQNCRIRDNISFNRAALLYYSRKSNSVLNFFNNYVENNINVGTSGFAIEFRMINLANNCKANIVNNLFRNNINANTSRGASCGRFTNLASNGILDVHFLNNTIIDNPQGEDPLIPSPFAYESVGLTETNIYINNNIYFQNSGTTNVMALSLGSASDFTIHTDQSFENIQDFPSVDLLTNTHVVNSSPFVNYALNDFTPISAFQTTGNYQAYLNSYPSYDIAGNPRTTSDNQIGIGAFQAIPTVSTSQFYADNNIKCFPNPTDGEVGVNIGDEYDDLKLMVVDAMGRNVIEEKVVDNSKAFSFDLSNQKSGVYFVQLYSGMQMIKNSILIKK